MSWIVGFAMVDRTRSKPETLEPKWPLNDSDDDDEDDDDDDDDIIVIVPTDPPPVCGRRIRC